MTSLKFIRVLEIEGLKDIIQRIIYCECALYTLSFSQTMLAVRVNRHVQQNGQVMPLPPWGGTPYNGLYGEAPSERGTFFTFQVYERVGIS